ncbi:MAG: Crp/Fnr family transcriptional regulator [Acidobacteriaceae bacterium]|nr:Crp/Fnr family transcriptional regulator [Acidobacteriaceae bacterium]MBV9781148.1 Crp/Fnr family transcriptional regulator [Acidobacteriaceae bacterium]
MSSLAPDVATVLTTQPEVSHVGPIRRSSLLFSQDQAADSLYLIQEGLVKLVRRSDTGSRMILCISGPKELIGEEGLSETLSAYQADAEALTICSGYRIPRQTIANLVPSNTDFAASLINLLLQKKLALAQKVELLCFRDVEFRILHYLAELSELVQATANGEGHQLPITQAELADLIGATRETTSTTLNQLERKGLVKLSRRLLTVPSPATLRSVISNKEIPSQAAAGSL